jgi:YHS domain-containing protein
MAGPAESADAFSTRLDEVDREARQSREKFHTQAGEEAKRLAERFRKFETVRDAIRQMFEPRLTSLLERLPGAKPLLEIGADRGEARVLLGHTAECPPSVTLTMSVSHDGRAERVTLDYALSIVPVFMEFKPNARFESAIDPFDRAGAEKWMDDCLVEFLRTYRRIPLVEAYQKDRMVLDPVARVWFGKGLAKAQREVGGTTYYFASDEAASEFDRDPARYQGAPGRK